MRRLSLSFLFLLFCYCLSASPVGAERARCVAKSFLGVRPTGSNNRALSMRARGGDTDAPAYYVFNLEGGGFVIVSGDDAVTPILAYSRTGYFETEDMPENLAGWMKGLESSILEIRSSGTPPSEKTRKQWKQLETGWYAPSASGEKVLETALWDQHEPFNRNCPRINGQKALTGCTATAGAIIMRYHQYPERGVGTLEGYDYTQPINNHERSFHVDGHDLGHTYDWENMPLTYESGSFTQEQARQVAQLMWDIGVMSHMMYGDGVSGASQIDLVIGMVRYMGYDASACYVQHENYTDNEWIDLLINEIDNGRPVLYTGLGPSGGMAHASVCDGYDQDGLMHFNWGWSGKSNGFFSLKNTTWTDAYINLEPNHGGTPGVNSRGIMLTSISSHLNLVDGNMGPGTVLCADVYSHSYSYFQGYIAIGKYREDGLLQQVISESKELLLDNGSWGIKNSSFTEITIPSVFSPGEYMAPCYSMDGNTWFAPDENGPPLGIGYLDRIYPNVIASMLKDTSLFYSRSKKQVQVSTPVPVSYQFKTPSDGWSELCHEQENIIIDGSQPGSYMVRLCYPGLSHVLYIIL